MKPPRPLPRRLLGVFGAVVAGAVVPMCHTRQELARHIGSANKILW